MNAGMLNPIANWPWFLGAGLIVLLIWIADQMFAPISTLPYGLIGFFGNRGRGKTFTAVSYARRWRHQHPKQAVYTNLDKLVLPGSGPIYLSCTMEQITEARDCLVLIDEAGVFLNAWNYVSQDQRAIARWIASTRHYGVTILMTAHLPEHINKRVRDVIDEMYFMESFQGLRVFRAKVYESAAGVKKNQASKTVWIPKLPSICNSYDTNSLRSRAEAEGVNVVGTDEVLLGPTGKPATIDKRTQSADDNTPIGLAPTREISPTSKQSKGAIRTRSGAFVWKLGDLIGPMPNDDHDYSIAPEPVLEPEPEPALVSSVNNYVSVIEQDSEFVLAPQHKLVTHETTIMEATKPAEPDTIIDVSVRSDVTQEDLDYVFMIAEWFKNNGGKVYTITTEKVIMESKAA